MTEYDRIGLIDSDTVLIASALDSYALDHLFDTQLASNQFYFGRMISPKLDEMFITGVSIIQPSQITYYYILEEFFRLATQRLKKQRANDQILLTSLVYRNVLVYPKFFNPSSNILDEWCWQHQEIEDDYMTERFKNALFASYTRFKPWQTSTWNWFVTEAFNVVPDSGDKNLLESVLELCRDTSSNVTDLKNMHVTFQRKNGLCFRYIFCTWLADFISSTHLLLAENDWNRISIPPLRNISLYTYFPKVCCLSLFSQESFPCSVLSKNHIADICSKKDGLQFLTQ